MVYSRLRHVPRHARIGLRCPCRWSHSASGARRQNCSTIGSAASASREEAEGVAVGLGQADQSLLAHSKRRRQSHPPDVCTRPRRANAQQQGQWHKSFRATGYYRYPRRRTSVSILRAALCLPGPADTHRRRDEATTSASFHVQGGPDGRGSCSCCCRRTHTHAGPGHSREKTCFLSVGTPEYMQNSPITCRGSHTHSAASLELCLCWEKYCGLHKIRPPPPPPRLDDTPQPEIEGQVLGTSVCGVRPVRCPRGHPFSNISVVCGKFLSFGLAPTL
jgi:hypothetical protein